MTIPFEGIAVPRVLRYLTRMPRRTHSAEAPKPFCGAYVFADAYDTDRLGITNVEAFHCVPEAKTCYLLFDRAD